MKLKIKKWYLEFLERDKRNFGEAIFYFCLCQLSFVYGVCVGVRNFLYDAKCVTIYKSTKKIISVGGLSWAGAGKTTLALCLYDKLRASQAKVCILRRGYGDDENELIRAHTSDLAVAVDRVRLVQDLEPQFDIFILDDGFQYRKLFRDYDIVMMTAGEWKKKIRLLPASIFREGLASLGRARAMVVTYTADDNERALIAREAVEMFPALKVYFARHVFKRFLDTQKRLHEPAALAGRKVAALSGVGYPKGFFELLRQVGIAPERTFVYPDHYVLSQREFDDLERDLINQGIHDLVITKKDFYHIPKDHLKINLITMEIDMQIYNEDVFLQDLKDLVLAHV
ncbi:MAG: tetraacyldisaccharide 4'-kinase [Candidatus Omnitrophota bacterium]